jgi:4-hydroxy-tetrahydrodipicolinate synthase
MTPKLVERLLQAYPNTIAGMKDSSGDWNNTKTFLDGFAETARPVADSPRKAQTGFDVFVGSETFLLANMRDGGAGTISATANVNPAAIDALYQSAKCQAPKPKPQRNSNQRLNVAAVASAVSADDDLDAQQARLNVVREVFSSRKFPSIIAAVKQAIAIYANDPEWARVRPPLLQLTTEQAGLLDVELKKVGLGWNALCPTRWHGPESST